MKFDAVEHLEAIQTLFGAEFAQFSHFNQVMTAWKGVLGQASEVKREAETYAITKNGTTAYMEETYTQDIDFGDKGDYQWEWDIVAAHRLLMEAKRPLNQMRVSSLMELVQTEHLDWSNEGDKLSELPIIVIDSAVGHDGGIILNGNHRIVEAKERGDAVLEGYYMQNDEHVAWMLSDHMRRFYECLRDIKHFDTLMMRRQLGQIAITDDEIYTQLFIAKRMGS